MNAFAEVMRGGAGNTLDTGSSEEDDKPDAKTSMQSATGIPSIATSSLLHGISMQLINQPVNILCQANLVEYLQERI